MRRWGWAHLPLEQLLPRLVLPKLPGASASLPVPPAASLPVPLTALTRVFVKDEERY